MTRIIKFRGRDASGTWFFGDLHQWNNGEVYIGVHGSVWTDDGMNSQSYSSINEIDPETVGQFTGLYDKNDKEIYEGDIVYILMKDGSDCHCVIGYDIDNLAFGIMDEYAYRSKMQGRNRNFDNGFMHRLYKDSLIFEVRGNIHDNPELIKVED